jgi:hypothetical protein
MVATITLFDNHGKSTRQGVEAMQTMLKVICDNRGQASMVEDYLVRFCAKAANEEPPIEFPPPDADDVAFVRDDAEEIRGNGAEQPRAQLGGFGSSPNEANNKTKIIYINPVILSYGCNGQKLHLWVSSPSPGTAGNAEST